MGDFCWIFLKFCGMVCATKINGENPKEKIMEKAIFYVRAMRGEGTGESYEDIIARYQAKMQEKGICEIVDSYADGSPLDDLIESDSLIYFVVVMPEFGLSTRKIFECFDEDPDFVFADNDKLSKAVQKEDLSQIRDNVRNGLQQTAFKTEPKLKDIFDKVSKFGKTCMTGSGSCLFLVADSVGDSQYIAEQICKQGVFAVPAESRAFGIEFVEFKI